MSGVELDAAASPGCRQRRDHETPGSEPTTPRDCLLVELRNRQPLLAGLNAATAGIVFLVVQTRIGMALPAAWFAILAAVQLARVATWRRDCLIPMHGDQADDFARRMTWYSGMTGLAWGTGGVLFYSVGSLAVDTFLPFVFAGIVTAAMVSLTTHPPAFHAFYIPLLALYALRAAAEGDVVHQAIALIVVVFGIGAALIGRQIHKSMFRSATLHIANGELVESLRTAQGDLEMRVRERTRQLEEANSDLSREITERLRSEARIRHLLDHDPLTNLPNRILLIDRLEQALARGRRDRTMTGVMTLNLDRFKEINDTMGHRAGDALLRDVAERLRENLREADTIARMVGDEFAVIAGDMRDIAHMLRLAGKLKQAIEPPFEIDGRMLVICGSIGIAVFPDHGSDVDDLLVKSDLALYAAKRDRSGGIRLYADDMHAAAQAQNLLEHELQQAISASQLTLVYQPRFDLESGGLSGTEALVRWQHPSRGTLRPDDFVPLAERSRLICSLGDWVLDQAVMQARLWSDADRPIAVAVNVSPVQLKNGNFAASVKETLERHGLDPRLLELEITESAYVGATGSAVHAELRALRKLGISLAIDDFGTGYSSLAYLKWLPFDVVKIDRSFITNIQSDRYDEAIVGAVIQLAQNFEKRVVAEGVEIQAQLVRLRSMGCNEAQGFLLGRPQTADGIGGRLLVPA